MCISSKKNYRLGIDLGSTSLGWCVLELDADKNPIGILDMGVRIFPDGRNAKSKEPLSVARRGYRGQRRNLDRYLLRLKTLVSYFLSEGFLPEDAEARKALFMLNPLELRSKALDTPLTSGEFARAIIHLSKRRGFRSNRKIQSDKATAYTEAINNLKAGLEASQARSLGEYLWQKYQKNPAGMEHHRQPIKFRYDKKTTETEPIFPLRSMVEDEFNAIWEAQSKFNTLLSETAKAEVFRIIFTQREFKIPPKGKCQLIPEEERAPKAHPLFQEFRIRQDLNNLKANDVFQNTTVELSDEQYNTLYELLDKNDKRSFEQLRKALWGKQFGDYRFNLEANDRKDLQGNRTRTEINRKGNEDIKSFWDTYNSEQQEDIISIIVSDLDDEPATAQLCKLGVPPELVNKMLNLKLPGEYCHLSIKALKQILPYMRKRVIYSKACELAGLNHSGEFSGEVFPDGNLPYYGELLKRETISSNRYTGDEQVDEHGRINNPTVHIALNQLQKLVNALCTKYGCAPQEIVLELGKDLKLSKDEKERLNKSANANKKMNEQVDELLRSEGINPNRQNRLKAKLWLELGATELDRRCVYSGKQISWGDLFTHKIEVDHILPKSRTYDDGSANKILCIAEANRYKKERSPFEAFGKSKDGYIWADIISRANCLPENKKRRFQAEAMQSYEDKNLLLERMLNDTRYMSRVARKYMCYICGENNVWSITGRHTALLRGKWGLNSALGEGDSKDRRDHRHHAIDAFVIALTTRSMVKKLADNIEKSTDRFIENLEAPYPNFNYEEFTHKVNQIITSFKPDQINPAKLGKRQQTGGSLMEETAYSYEGVSPDNPKFCLYGVRKAVSEITEKNCDEVASPELRRELEQLAQHYKGADFKAQVALWAKERNIKKLKLVSPMNPDGMIPVYNKDGIAFKYLASGENLFADIYIKDPYAENPKWSIEIVNSFKAHQPGFRPEWKQNFPKAKKLMRVFKNDIVAIDKPEGGRELRRVKKMTKGILFLREINVATKDKALDDIGEQYSPLKLQQLRACKAGVDIIGRWFDPLGTNDEQRS